MKLQVRTVVAAALLGLSFSAFAGEPAKAQPEANKTVKLNIEKMACGSCSQKVTEALSSIDGVKTAKVDFKAKGATVEINASKVTPEQLVKAVQEAGFEASLPKS